MVFSYSGCLEDFGEAGEVADAGVESVDGGIEDVQRGLEGVDRGSQRGGHGVGVSIAEGWFSGTK